MEEKKYRCPKCGEIFVGEQSECPHCHVKFASKDDSNKELEKKTTNVETSKADWKAQRKEQLKALKEAEKKAKRDAKKKPQKEVEQKVEEPESKEIASNSPAPSSSRNFLLLHHIIRAIIYCLVSIVILAAFAIVNIIQVKYSYGKHMGLSMMYSNYIAIGLLALNIFLTVCLKQCFSKDKEADIKTPIKWLVILTNILLYLAFAGVVGFGVIYYLIFNPKFKILKLATICFYTNLGALAFNALVSILFLILSIVNEQNVLYVQAKKACKKMKRGDAYLLLMSKKDAASFIETAQKILNEYDSYRMNLIK